MASAPALPGAHGGAVARRNPAGPAGLAEIDHAFGHLQVGAGCFGLQGEGGAANGRHRRGGLDLEARAVLGERLHAGVDFPLVQPEAGVHHAGLAILGQSVEQQARVRGQSDHRTVGQHDGGRSGAGQDFVADSNQRVRLQDGFAPVVSGHPLHGSGHGGDAGRFRLSLEPGQGNTDGGAGVQHGGVVDAVVLAQLGLAVPAGQQLLGDFAKAFARFQGVDPFGRAAGLRHRLGTG